MDPRLPWLETSELAWRGKKELAWEAKEELVWGTRGVTWEAIVLTREPEELLWGTAFFLLCLVLGLDCISVSPPSPALGWLSEPAELAVEGPGRCKLGFDTGGLLTCSPELPTRSVAEGMLPSKVEGTVFWMVIGRTAEDAALTWITS